MGSRIKTKPSRLFDCFLEIRCPPEDGSKDASILRSFPFQYKDKEQNKLQMVPMFAFPCQLNISQELAQNESLKAMNELILSDHKDKETDTGSNVQNFSFVMTDGDSQWTFGFCRQAPLAKSAFVILSSVPWHSLFFSILNHAGELNNNNSSSSASNDGYCDGEMWKYIEAVYNSYNTTRLPIPGSLFHVTWSSVAGGPRDFTAQVPQSTDLPEIPENRNLLEYFNAVGLDTMFEIFASMLHERRIIVTSSKLHRLSACVQAANSIMYPMFWQHIFIPILPRQLIPYLQAPMPFLIGVPAPMMSHVRMEELGEVVILDADANRVVSPFQDLLGLPDDVVANFRRAQKAQGRDLAGDAVARLFLRATVHLIGGYRSALKMRPGEKITFDDDAFLNTRSSTVRPFLETILQLQIFRQFIEDRLQMLNDGKVGSDEFEKEILIFAEKLSKSNSAKVKAAALGSSVKRESGAIVKAVKENVKTQVNPAVKQAVKSVKATGKSAYKGVRSKMKENHSSSNLTGGSGTLRVGNSWRTDKDRRMAMSEDMESKPRSAPASPVMNGRKTVIGEVGIEENHSTGSSVRTNSSGENATGGNKGNMFRANTELGFKGAVFKYDRFDPPLLLSATSSNASGAAGPSEMASHTFPDSSPEFEAMPPLNLDLMSEPEMQDIFNRKTSPLFAAAAAATNKGQTGTIQSPQDLITFQGHLSTTEEHEVIFDPLVATSEPDPKLPAAPPRRASVSNSGRGSQQQQQQFPMPPFSTAGNNRGHRPLSRTAGVSSASGASVNPALRKSNDLLLEYGLDFTQLATTSSSHQRPLTVKPVSKPPPPPPISAASLTAVPTATVEDPFDDLDPLKSTRKHVSTSAVAAAPPQHRPVAPPRRKASEGANVPRCLRSSNDSSGLTGSNPRYGWTTFE